MATYHKSKFLCKEFIAWKIIPTAEMLMNAESVASMALSETLKLGSKTGRARQKTHRERGLQKPATVTVHRMRLL